MQIKSEFKISHVLASYAIIALGIWLIFCPFTFGFESSLIKTSDIVSGCALIVFASYALIKRTMLGFWLSCLVGVWLQLAPLIFWAPVASMYLNDTIIGFLALLFSFVLVDIANEDRHTGQEIPAGWSHNPSGYSQRVPVVALAFFCWQAARYMAGYQLGYSDAIFDPVFGDGTLKVITSDISSSFPVSDAGLGAIVYTLEVILGCSGSTRRWYTTPWLVLGFGILVIPAGVVSIILIMLQPIVVGHWCFWCLLTAFCMLIMITLTVDEVLASLQVLYSVRKKALWKTLWHGVDAKDSLPDHHKDQLSTSFYHWFTETFRGVSLTWSLLLSFLIGACFMTVPSLFSIDGDAAAKDDIFGALIVVVSIISCAEVLRSLRYLNIIFALIVIIITYVWVDVPIVLWSHVALGVILIGITPYRGKIKQKYGDWSRFIK